MTACSICGATEFRSDKVLSPQLIADWQLSAFEVAYIDRQQGRCCTRCGANLRIIALGHALREFFHTDLPVREYAQTARAREHRILDINGAVAISAALSSLPGYVRGDFPDINLLALRFADATFDLVVHSDTLEHVEHPGRALEECRRILTPNGKLCFTIPVIVGRMTRSRAGLPHSYHGDPSRPTPDLLVYTEFGADAWTMVMQAGFTHVSLSHVEYPAAIAFTAW